jgi:transposase
MPKGKYLTDAEKIQINLYRGSEISPALSIREIARKIGRSDHVVRNYIAKGDNYGVKKATNGNKVLTNRQINRIRFEATKNKLNATQIKDKLLLPVTNKHVAHILRTTPNVKWKKPHQKPMLKKHHKIARLQFAKNHMHWTHEWQNVIFSDEKKFNLDGPDSYSCYWHDLRGINDPQTKRNYGGGSLMVWGGFSYSGKLTLCCGLPKMNSIKYTEMLDDVLITYMDENMDDNAIFQQDNAAIHTSRHSMKWFKDHNIPVLEWPACSPDLNPIENVWGMLSRKVYDAKAAGHQFKTVTELKCKILEAWSELDQTTLQRLVESMKGRIFEVIQCNGGHTHY